MIYTGVCCGKNTPPEKKRVGQISLQHTKSGAGEQLLLQDCRAQSAIKGMFFSQTPVSNLRARVLDVRIPATHISCSGLASENDGVASLTSDSGVLLSMMCLGDRMIF